MTKISLTSTGHRHNLGPTHCSTHLHPEAGEEEHEGNKKDDPRYKLLPAAGDVPDDPSHARGETEDAQRPQGTEQEEEPEPGRQAVEREILEEGEDV